MLRLYSGALRHLQILRPSASTLGLLRSQNVMRGASGARSLSLRGPSSSLRTFPISWHGLLKRLTMASRTLICEWRVFRDDSTHRTYCPKPSRRSRGPRSGMVCWYKPHQPGITYSHALNRFKPTDLIIIGRAQCSSHRCPSRQEAVLGLHAVHALSFAVQSSNILSPHICSARIASIWSHTYYVVFTRLSMAVWRYINN